MRKALALISFTFFLSLSNNILLAQAPQSWTSAEMYLALRKLNVLGSALYVAAHPDDENTRLIAWLSKDRLYRTGYLSITRGDGGQNLIGNEQGIELGLIRTQELLAARRVDGGEQFFTRAYDFGYSKNPAETFTKWDKDKILADVVWVIRNFQPDVIINRFPSTGEGGHGHHTASAILAIEAFSAAADPKRFPEQLSAGSGGKYVQVWQAKRILWNSFNFGGTNLTSPDQFKFDVGGYNPLLGKSYGEIAAESRSQHKSQGFGVPAGRGEAMEFFKTIEGSTPTNELMDGVDLSWSRVKGGEPIQKMVDSLVNSFDFLQPGNSVKGLVKLYQSLGAMPAGHWRNKKLEETRQLIQQCSGLFLDATTSDQFAVKTDSIRVNFSFNNRLGSNAILKKISIVASQPVDSVFNQPLTKNKNLNFSKTYYVGPGAVETQPYWLDNDMAEGYYNVADQQNIGKPDVDPTYWLAVDLNIEGQDIQFLRPVKYKFTDPVRGELYQPLVVLPPLLVSIDDKFKVTKGDNNFNGVINVTARKKNINAYVKGFGIGDGDPAMKFTYEPKQLSFQSANTTLPISYKIAASKNNHYKFWVSMDSSSTTPYYFKDMVQVKYEHIPNITYFSDASVENIKLDLKTHHKRIGYIVGAGDKVPEALEHMGFEVVLLTDKELSRNNLGQYDAILTGVRAYNTNDWMNKHFDKLMRYVSDGGNLIVQYNTSSNLGPVRAKIGPYNFTIARTRITDENSPVTFLKPGHPVLNFPNTITADDFKGWIQERSIYHAAGWDSTKFETVLALNDPGEKPDEGSLIITRHGKGYFSYTGLVFFRQLPAGVPGAYRLLANLIALNRKKGF